jgi:hypothetical protein
VLSLLIDRDVSPRGRERTRDALLSSSLGSGPDSGELAERAERDLAPSRRCPPGLPCRLRSVERPGLLVRRLYVTSASAADRWGNHRGRAAAATRPPARLGRWVAGLCGAPGDAEPRPSGAARGCRLPWTAHRAHQDPSGPASGVRSDTRKTGSRRTARPRAPIPRRTNSHVNPATEFQSGTGSAPEYGVALSALVELAEDVY